MKDPIKIIHKFKNINRRVQYILYIFIGSLVPSPVYNVLKLIKDTDFYNTLITLKQNEYDLLVKTYGEYWYELFFISYHINAQKKIINNIKIKTTTLEKKYGKEWFNKHIQTNKQKASPHSFAHEYYNYLIDRKKIKNINNKSDFDYRTYNIDQDGGDIIIQNDEEDENDEDIKDEEPQNDENIEDEFDLDELTKIYQTVDVESKKENDDITKLISDAINNKTWEKKADTINITYNDKYDTLAYDMNIDDIYEKNYIIDQYLFKDDSIKSIKNKITTSIPLSQQLGASLKILPECQSDN